MAAAGLAPIQGKALRYLDEPMNMRELARRLKVDASYITSIVDGLEEQGLVDRTVQPTDRRVKNLVLTPKGRQRTAELHEELFAEVPAIGSLSRQKRAVFRDLLLEMLGS
jgi:DNA-binding MarR family transcriptional regulator